MKKLVAIILAFAMLLSMAVVANAATAPTTEGTAGELYDVALTSANCAYGANLATFNADGSFTITSEGTGYVSIALPYYVKNGTTVTIIVEVSGTPAAGKWRGYLATDGGNWQTNSQSSSITTYYKSSAEAETVVYEATANANALGICFKADGSASSMAGLTVSSLKVFFGTKAQYEQYAEENAVWSLGNMPKAFPGDPNGAWHTIVNNSTSLEGLYEALAKDGAVLNIRTSLTEAPGWANIIINGTNMSEGKVNPTRALDASGKFVLSVSGSELIAAAGATSESIISSLTINGGLVMQSAYNVEAVYVTASEPAKAMVTYSNGNIVGFDSVQAAINSVSATGGTVKLSSDATEAVVLTPSNVTLDLNGNTLTADYFVSIGFANVVDTSADKSGRLNVPQDGLSIGNPNNEDIPVWNEGEGYLFATMELRETDPTIPGDGTVSYLFKPVLGTGLTSDTYFGDGALDNGIELGIRLTWDTANATGSQSFVYYEGYVREAYADPTLALSFAADGLGEYTNMQMHVIVKTTLGLEKVLKTYQITSAAN